QSFSAARCLPDLRTRTGGAGRSQRGPLIMATLYKPKIATYRLPDGSYRTPDGQRVTKATPGAVRDVHESKVWYGRWTDANVKELGEPLSEKKDIARRLLAKKSGDAQMEGGGLKAPFEKHKARSLLDHLEDFRRYLTAKDRCPEHVAKTFAQCRAI